MQMKFELISFDFFLYSVPCQTIRLQSPSLSASSMIIHMYTNTPACAHDRIVTFDYMCWLLLLVVVVGCCFGSSFASFNYFISIELYFSVFLSHSQRKSICVWESSAVFFSFLRSLAYVGIWFCGREIGSDGEILCQYQNIQFDLMTKTVDPNGIEKKNIFNFRRFFYLSHGVIMLSACRISMHRNEFCNRKRFDEGQWAVGKSPFNQMTRVASIDVPKSNPHKQTLCAPCCMSMTCTQRLQLTPLHAAWMNEWNEWQKESDVLVVSVLLGHAVGQL